LFTDHDVSVWNCNSNTCPSAACAVAFTLKYRLPSRQKFFTSSACGSTSMR
jgi:hypothetical protein